eukprot:174201-Pyramimonas_sp.AAC.1
MATSGAPMPEKQVDTTLPCICATVWSTAVLLVIGGRYALPMLLNICSTQRDAPPRLVQALWRIGSGGARRPLGHEGADSGDVA